MNKFFAFFAAFAVLCQSQASAQLEDGCCGALCYDYAYCPPVVLDSCCGWSGHVDYLYFKPDLRLNVADFLTADIRNNNASKDKSKIKKIKFDWDSGWRVGLDYRLPCDMWEVGVIWSHFQTSDTLSLNASDFTSAGGTSIQPILSINDPDLIPGDSSEAGAFNSKAQVNLNLIDFYTSREFFVGRSLTFNPTAGLRLIFVNHRLNYDFQDTQNQAGTEYDQYDFKGRSKFTGVGIFTGFSTFWELFCNLGLLADGKFSLLYANTDYTSGQEKRDETGQLDMADFNWCQEEITYTIDVGLYIRWAQPINCNTGLFTLRLGWETHYISDQNRWLYSDAYKPNNDPLTLQGFVFGLGVSF